MEWCQGKPCFCNCSSLLWKILFSNFQTLKKIQVTVRSSNTQFNIMRKSGGLKKGLSKDSWEIWGLRPLSKQCRSRLAETQSVNRRSYPESWTYQSNECCTSLGTIKGTHPHCRFQGDHMDKSTASPPVACREWAWKHTIQGQENLQNRAVHPLEHKILCSIKYREVKENVLRVQGGHHPSYVMVSWEVSHEEMTHHFCKKGVKLTSKCIKRTCY